MQNKTVADIIRESVEKQNARIDKKLADMRGTDPIHFSVMKVPAPPVTPAAKVPPLVPGELAKILSEITCHPSKKWEGHTPLENLDIPPELPPEFMFMHERVFLEGEPVENIDPDVASAGPKKWWEQDLRYVESENFDYHGMLEAEERAESLIQKWKK